jgi:hypothetical protein
MSREFVTKNIIECDHKSEPKEWHRNIKMFSNYKAQSSILNLTNGPIAEIGEWQEANNAQRDWEEVSLVRDQHRIAQMNET